MKTCPYCEAEIAHNAKKCKYCWEIVVEEKKARLCPYCEAEVPETAKKCRYCWEWIYEQSGTENIKGEKFTIKQNKKEPSKKWKFWCLKYFLLVIILIVWSIVVANIYDKYEKRKSVESTGLFILSEMYETEQDEDVKLIKNKFQNSYERCMAAAIIDWFEVNNNTKTSCVHMSILESSAICKIARINSSTGVWYSTSCEVIEKNAELLDNKIKNNDYEIFNIKK